MFVFGVQPAKCITEGGTGLQNADTCASKLPKNVDGEGTECRLNADTNYVSQVTLRNLISTLTRIKQKIYFVWTKFKYHL